MAGPEDPNNQGELPVRTSKSETLSYISDIVHELRQLADSSGYRTLSAILGVALVEARTQSEESER